ncbi:3-hydroxybutyryl-CoA dehydrogenase [Paracoccaceae bacterium]|mgnify:FL=1|jgi:3-hydroxybutyryl-CoA dehydrogenase|nr:3-hydroxybutyryl-CoA dehydrogenase [Paracoccaceae bacterium]
MNTIAAVGIGRMGRGIAISFAFSGHTVQLIDLKKRDKTDFTKLINEAHRDIDNTLSMFEKFKILTQSEKEKILHRISFHSLQESKNILKNIDVVFEGVPETIEAKKSALSLISKFSSKKTIIASTTSTILSNDLQKYVLHPERFLNAHWLNPAFLVPLVELSPGDHTDKNTTENLKQILENIGKVPIVCSASPGYIVPRIQALAMNEAARLVEEGVASAEDIDKATKYGFGFRFAVLGLLEFIDWGGGDILYYASQYMTKATGENRFAAPKIINDNMKENRNGLKDGKGFLNYENLDVKKYQENRLLAFVEMLKHLDKMPPKG